MVLELPRVLFCIQPIEQIGPPLRNGLLPSAVQHFLEQPAKPIQKAQFLSISYVSHHTTFCGSADF